MHPALLLVVVAVGADALKRSTTARCGIQSGNKLTCKGSVFGNCCSKSGYCGSSSAYCGTGCQAGFGDCKSSTAKPSSALAKSSSSTKVIVVSTAITAPSSKLSTPSAASTLSIVTSSSLASEILSTSPPDVEVPTDAISSFTPSSTWAPAAPSSSTQDVQVTKDAVSSSTSSSATSAASSTSLSKVSTDGSCGGTQGFTCSGSAFGNCCSEYGWCGNTGIYCDAGCNSAFGTCNGGSSSVQSSTTVPELTSSTVAPSSFTTLTRTSSAAPTPTQGVSTDGSCGANSLTCLGSTFGNCCSQYGYCGSSSGHCGSGCQSGFGNCDAPPAPGNICNVEGFANKAAYYASSYNLVDATDVSTCAALCLAEAGCNSYLFNPGLQNCAYLMQSLSQGEFIAAAGTNQFFWDRACAEATTA